ncbi:DUF222 domain-containing protein [Arthrobacter sp. zg-Y820]|uniref:HNH endonuclease signature motif containing protein n=1 Tax=unclassified Arthrobacter TaxID=235627 RepID=UPI001E478DE8|nr:MULTISPECIES: HNH endonuclease signature motif containing protein [unclassified Arthrobacter]MCC9196536.1 HNH endonuclease [Arthrobacter sp. zg-Y820]MDK1279398.1 DUF222 domain-containing protein [Arthrobacter sp. zg.Y820]WIB08221.1 DUF222 domain-containing protein [Arthrobacter sp. zg-Y820]
MDQNGSSTGTPGADGTGVEAAARTRFVYIADPGVAEAGVGPGMEAGEVSGVEGGRVSGFADRGGCPDGFTGSLVLQNVQSLTEEQTGDTLVRVDQLIRWAQAQQARLLARLQDIYQDGAFVVTGKLDPGLAFSLAAEEAATILGVPTGTGKALMSQAGDLCTRNTATLQALESGQISYGHAETLVEQCAGVVPAELPGFEAELLGMAAGQTRTQFRVKAQRLREQYYPETIVQRQLTAFEQRTVWVRPEPDGMSWLSALLPAEKAQAIFTQLSVAARGEQAAGDTRTVDQLRTDILTDLLGGHDHECRDECSNGGGGRGKGSKGSRGGRNAGGAGAGAKRGKGRRKGSGSGREASSGAKGSGSGKGAGSCRIGHGPRARTEILVVINAETLFGADDQPAELNGYGPISPVTARRMAREAAKWTPVERDPETEEILRVGKRRKVPDGLKRVLRVRDGTCRFPGCRTNAVISEIDHTKPWAQGGLTDHDNLEHLCRRHHMFKSEGFWKARQPRPGVIEWTSPGGRCYRTEPDLTLSPETSPETCEDDSVHLRRDIELVPLSDAEPGDYGDNPPPF